jgi:Holliday junction resolvase-like predicted endonuclease
VRVPHDAVPTRRFEIDVVLACRSCLVVVEVKNWSGDVSPDPAQASIPPKP